MHLLSLLLLLAFGSVFPAAAAVPVADRNTPGAFQTVDSFEKARPVWAEGRECEKNLTLSFRAVVQAGKGRKADIRVAASTAYRLKVNGVFVGHGPCVAAHGFYRVDVYDLAPYLQPGRNVVSLEVAGYNEPSYYLLDQPSFLQAEIRLGRRVVAWTGRDFRAFDLGLRKAGVPRFSFQRPFMEVWRLTPESGRWETDPDFLSENEVSLAEQAAGKTILRRVPYPDYTLREAVRADAPAEETYSFGKDATGFLGLEVEADGPVRLEALFDELLSAEGRVDPARLSVEGRVVWELAAGRYVLESFEPYTLQYVQLKTEGGPLRVRKVYLRDYCNADVRTGRLEGGRPDLVRLFEAARETLRQSSLDIFMDCPSRERAGWLCDSFFAARVAFDLSGDTLLEKNFLENYLLPERFPDVPEGMLPMCYPADHRNHVYIPNWAMWFVLQLEEYLGRSGDRALVDEARDRVYALIRFLDGYCNADGLLEKLDSWVFVEWSAANEYVQDVNYPSNMLFAGMLSAAGRLYGDPSLTARAEAVRAAVRAQSFDGKFFCDNALRQADGRLVRTENHTEVCQYYAFYFGVADPETHAGLWRRLREEFGPVRSRTRSYPDVPVANAFLGNYLRMELLSRAGLSRQVLDEAVAFFLPMADRTGTLWENMTPTASCNHGFASHVAHVLYRDACGLRVDIPSKTVTVRLRDVGMDWCSTVLPVPEGVVNLKWICFEGLFDYEIDVPEGYTVVEDIEEGEGTV